MASEIAKHRGRERDINYSVDLDNMLQTVDPEGTDRDCVRPWTTGPLQCHSVTRRNLCCMEDSSKIAHTNAKDASYFLNPGGKNALYIELDPEIFEGYAP